MPPPRAPDRPEPPARTRIVVLPFDLFGSGGAAEGALLLAEGLREMLADNRREQTATRARAYTSQVRFRDFSFESLADYAGWREQATRAARSLLLTRGSPAREGGFLVWLTGNHLGALPVYDVLGAADDALVVQLDAHLDLQQFSDHSLEPSHANFLLHCRRLPALVNVGHRDLLLPPEQVARCYRRAFSAQELAARPEAVEAELDQLCAGAGRIFLDLDCDVLDPAGFPAVAHPVPFGLAPWQLLRLVERIPPARLAGLILSEFVPGQDQNDRCLAALLWLVEYLLLRHHEAVPGQPAG